MARMSTSRPDRCSHTICLPVAESEYDELVNDAKRFRAWLLYQFNDNPELFPECFARGFAMKDSRVSRKIGVKLRRVTLRDGTAWTIRPSFVMPGMTGRTDDVQHAMLLRKFAVPFWVLAMIFGRDSMHWHRMQNALGRNSLAGTTVRKGTLPQHLLADEHHQRRDGQKVYVASTVGDGCWLGAEISESAGADDLTDGYRVFHDEALNIDPNFQPDSVNTDGWSPTKTAWSLLFPVVTVVECFLHAWLNIRVRGKKHELFTEASRRVWEAYRAANGRSFSQRLRHLRTWAESNLTGWIQEKTIRLCEKRRLWTVAYEHPGCHRTSNMLDRLMRGMNRYYTSTQHLHGSSKASRLTSRSQALLWNFAPWHPSNTSRQKWQSPAERLNKHRYHDNWLQNLLVSASCAGYRHRSTPPKA